MITLLVFGNVHPLFAEQLREFLSRASPGLSIDIKRCPTKLAEILDAWTGTQDLISTVAEAELDSTNLRVLCAVADRPHFKEWSISVLPHAEWGCAHGGFVALEYAPQASALVTQLHETLHCLGVDECYEEMSLQPKSTCSSSTCLMRYGANTLNVCESVLEQLKSNAS